MSELELFSRSDTFPEVRATTSPFDSVHRRAQEIADHKIWLQAIRRERPSAEKRYKIGIYIRYFNQTKYSDYLSYHKKQFEDTIALCPAWELTGFYVDEGSTPPNMESAPQWGQLLQDCMEGKVNLIITQKLSNVSKKSHEITLCAALLAQQDPPIGIYFISEDIFTLASYYLEDMRDPRFLPTPGEEALSDDSSQEDAL